MKLHPFFTQLSPIELTEKTFDQKVFLNDNKIKIVFMWGHDCPNCEVAKNVLTDRILEVKTLPLDWFHINVYEHSEIATRFGLHGIPAFFFFKNGKRLGKISPFPGWEPFEEAIRKLTIDPAPK